LLSFVQDYTPLQDAIGQRLMMNGPADLELLEAGASLAASLAGGIFWGPHEGKLGAPWTWLTLPCITMTVSSFRKASLAQLSGISMGMTSIDHVLRSFKILFFSAVLWPLGCSAGSVMQLVTFQSANFCRSGGYSLTLCLALSLALVGCGKISMTFDSSWHSEHQWNATDYFDDPQLLALCEAIEADDSEAARGLIDAGVDINTTGEFGMTPLLWALPGNTNKCFSLLLDEGANPDVRISKRVGIGEPKY